MANERNLLGTVIYEPNNTEQQKIVVKDLQSNKEQEFSIKHGKEIEHDNRRHDLKGVLTVENYVQLYDAVRKNEPTSFMLSKKELNNMQDKQLITANERTNENQLDTDLVRKIDELKTENQKLQKQVNSLEKSFKLTYLQFNSLAKDKSERLKDSMQKVADKAGIGKTFKEKTEEFDRQIKQREQQNDKEQKVEKASSKDNDLSLR